MKAVKSYASIYKLLLKLRPGTAFHLLHVLSNLTRLPGLRKRVLTRSIRHRIDIHRADDKTKTKSKRTSAIIQLTHRHGACIATVKTRREPQAREAMLNALRELEQQVREDDSLR